jgi:hypothetical protein
MASGYQEAKHGSQTRNAFVLIGGSDDHLRRILTSAPLGSRRVPQELSHLAPGADTGFYPLSASERGHKWLRFIKSRQQIRALEIRAHALFPTESATDGGVAYENLHTDVIGTAIENHRERAKVAHPHLLDALARFSAQERPTALEFTVSAQDVKYRIVIDGESKQGRATISFEVSLCDHVISFHSSGAAFRASGKIVCVAKSRNRVRAMTASELASQP